ncbi:hypothetical protein [Pseudomonas sp. SG20052]|uniref:hypothetical protein n=1 Tax=Pseudomonas sp. SG20052 TaxID=3074147 RepID=UPI00287FC106|nr:hypothetical protein [Pseudomonas sp. SG20052]WNF55804.1 hypothetical protein RHP74_00495 [Pseudomonas sp. SG20052]
MNSEIIAKLVGALTFQVDISGLQRFERGLAQARQKMMALSREADVLSKKLGTKMGIKVDSAARDKLDKSVRASLDRELKLEQSLQRTKRATFAAELAGMKLTSAGNKENAALQGQVLRDKIGQAVLEAKSAKAAQERLKASGLEVKQAQSLEAHKLRQAKMEAVLATAQQRTVLLQQRQQAGMTAMQRAELALQQSRTRAQRATEKHQASVIAQKVREDRLATRTQQQAEKHGWATQRQAAWAAKQAAPAPSTGFMGLGTGALALGGVTAGLAAVVAAVGALGDRLSATQARVSDSQQFSNILEQAAGKNPANKDFAKAEFLRISQKYGTAVDNDSAKDYRTYLLAQMARGKSLSAATEDFETTMSAYRGAGLTRDEQRRTSLQYQQVRSKTVADREDLNTFSEAAPLLVEPIRRAWAERNKHALDANLEKDFRASTKTSNLKAIDFENGIKLFVKENAAAIERQNGSIEANATRLASQQFLQQQGLDESPELIGAINERIKAEMDLTEAMKPFKETMVQFDIGLARVAASMLRLTAGKNGDGTEKTEKDRAQEVGSAGFPEGAGAIDPSVMGGGPRPSTGEKVKDPISLLFRWLTNTPDYEEGPFKANKVDVGGMFNKLDLSKFGAEPPDETGQMRQFRPYQPFTSADIMSAAEERQLQKQPAPSWLGAMDINGQVINKPDEKNIDQSMHTDIKIDVVVNAIDPNGKALGDAIGDAVTEKVDAKVSQLLQTTRSAQKEVE